MANEKKGKLFSGPFSVRRKETYLGEAFEVVDPNGKVYSTNYGHRGRMLANISAIQFSSAYRMGYEAAKAESHEAKEGQR